MSVSLSTSYTNPYAGAGFSSAGRFGNQAQAYGGRTAGGASSLAQARLTGQGGAGGDASLIGNLQKTSDARAALREQLRDLQREKQRPQNPFALTSESIVDTLWGKEDDKDESKDRIVSSQNYNFKEVSNKIQRAKTSTSAGRAVLAAKRKVVELKRKLASGDGDSDDLELALNHAKRIERVAKKKQHHLELEEMVAATRRRDENRDKMEETADGIKDAARAQLEEELSEKQNDFDERQTALFSEAAQELREKLKDSAEEASDEMIAALDAVVDGITEEEKEMLEKAAELLESMETVDPHMSEAKFKELKTKHRNQENKEIVKADVDYLKASMKHAQEKNSAIPGFGGAPGISSMPAFSVGVDVSVAPSAADVAMTGFDASA